MQRAGVRLSRVARIVRALREAHAASRAHIGLVARSIPYAALGLGFMLPVILALALADISRLHAARARSGEAQLEKRCR